MPRCRLLDACLALATLIAQAAHAQASAEPLLLEVYVNGVDTEKVGTFERRDGRLYATPNELRELGLSTAAAGEAMLALDRLPGVTVAFDEREQSVRLTVPVAGLASHAIGVRRSEPGVVDATPLGVLINYDVTATSAHGRVDMYGLGSARVFGAFGTLQSDATVTRSGSATRVIRLDTTFSRSDPERLRTWAAGDVASGALPYSRSVRLGGAQVATNFALRPDLVTYPLPVVSGGAAVPSTVDVLVNGVKQLSQPVEAGPFYVPQLPVVTGAGQVSVAVRDAAGRQTIQTSSFYTSAALLAPGLDAISVEIGAVRRNFGVDGANYGKLAASATGRRGVTDRLTLDAHVEAAGDLALVSGGGTFQLGNAAVVTLAAGGSTSERGNGGQLYAALERSAHGYHLGLSALMTTPQFADIGALAGDPPPRHIVQANAGVVFGRQGSLGVAYTDVSQRGVSGSGAASAPLATGSGYALRPAIRTSLVSATYSRELFGRAYAYVTGYQDLRNRNGAVMGGISFRFGRGGSVNAGYESASHRATFEASQPATDPGEIGWRAYAAGGSDSRLLAEARYRGSRGEIGVGADRYGGTTYFQANARGGVVALGGGVAATNTVTDGFALVDTHGLAGVPVTLNNRPVGRTGRSGRLVVPGLVAYQPNVLAIDPSALPLDASWSGLETTVRPGERAGAIARFGLKLTHPLLLVLRDAGGQVLPVGTRLSIGDTAAAVVGYDGQAYFDDFVGSHLVNALTPDGIRCSFAVSGGGEAAVAATCRPSVPTTIALSNRTSSLPR